jgi:predicted TIM-barrel fold metal-dependent hydrolase
MIINFHEHPYEGVGEHNTSLGIDRMVLLADRDTNDLVCDMAQRDPQRYIPFYRADVNDIPKSCAELRHYVQHRGVRGVKFQPLSQSIMPNDPKLYPFYEVCQELRAIVLFHAGVVAFPKHYVRFGNPVQVDDVAWDFPDLRIVIAHLGGNYSYEAMVICSNHPNVYMDTAYLHFFCDRSLPQVQPIELVARAVRFCGPEKILFASEDVHPSLIADSHLPENTRKLILSGNALRLLDEQ